MTSSSGLEVSNRRISSGATPLGISTIEVNAGYGVPSLPSSRTGYKRTTIENRAASRSMRTLIRAGLELAVGVGFRRSRKLGGLLMQG
jgi:hypothetical protein